MGEGEQLYIRREELIELFDSERAVITHRDKAQARANPVREKLPRHQIAMVLHFREQNHVAFAQEFSAPCLRDQVDAFRRSTREDDLIRAGRPDVLSDPRPRALVSFGRARAQLVKAAVDVGVIVLVVMAQRLDDASRLLRRGRVIKVHQWMPVDLLVEDREIFPHPLPINRSLGPLMHVLNVGQRATPVTCQFGSAFLDRNL